MLDVCNSHAAGFSLPSLVIQGYQNLQYHKAVDCQSVQCAVYDHALYQYVLLWLSSFPGLMQDVQHVIDPTEWMQQLTASAQILSIDSMASILLSRLDKLQEAEERARQSSLTHAAANSAADAHARAGDGSTADSEPASSAHGATAGRLSHDRGTPSQNGSTSSIAHTSHAEAPNSHGSAHSADASGTLQQGMSVRAVMPYLSVIVSVSVACDDQDLSPVVDFMRAVTCPCEHGKLGAVI